MILQSHAEQDFFGFKFNLCLILSLHSDNIGDVLLLKNSYYAKSTFIPHTLIRYY